MKRKPKPKSTDSKQKKSKRVIIILDYYQRPFILLHQESKKSGYDPKSPHLIRGRFWRHPIPGYYDQDEAIKMLKRYFISLERELADVIGRNSIAYWLHVYRRLSPGFIVSEQQLGNHWSDPGRHSRLPIQDSTIRTMQQNRFK